MKKLAVVFGGLFVVTVVALIVVYNMLGGIVQKGVETVGPKATGVPVSLAGVDISLFSGKAGLDGFVIDNPQGFTDNKAFELGKVRTQVDIGSVMSDVIVVKSILVDGSKISWEGWGGDNHRKIMENIKKFAGTSEKADAKAEKSSGPAKKVIVEDFLFQNSSVNFVMGGQEVATVKLPDVHMTDVGKADGGQDIQKIVEQLYAQIFSGMSGAIASNKQLLTKSLGDLTGKGEEVLKAGQDALGGATGGTADKVQKLTDGFGGLFKKQ
jgi:hypothetical protein